MAERLRRLPRAACSWCCSIRPLSPPVEAALKAAAQAIGPAGLVYLEGAQGMAG